MKNKTTIQDIADSLNLSRATVSKVVNHSPGVSDDTRQAVLAKLQELNYKNAERVITMHTKTISCKPLNFAFLMHTLPGDLHVGSTIMTRLEQEIRKEGYSLTIHTITDEDFANMELPPNLYIDQTVACVCLELFHSEYSRLLCSLGLPILFVDAPSDFHGLDLQCDLLMMENRSSVYRMLSALCKRHQLKTMGFFGDANHCLSFRERFEGLMLAAQEHQVETRGYHLMDNDRLFWDPEWIEESLKNMDRLPDLFFCANDVLAQNLILGLQKLGYRVPEDVLVCGFDGIPTKNPIISNLTTICTPSQTLGVVAAQILMQRIQNPSTTPISTYLHTDILFRSSAP